MKRLREKAMSLVLAAVMLCALGTAAWASPALGEDMDQRDVLLHEQTALSTNVFWSTTYSDLRTEHLITYKPSTEVRPVVTYGASLTACNTLSAAAKGLEAEGLRVVAGMNGDFFNLSTGLPIGMVVTEGQLRSSDAGYYAIGFRPDGSALLGKPGVKLTADLGYMVTDAKGYSAEVVRNAAGLNKARVSTGGIYIYTSDFNHGGTTGTTETGVDVLCNIEDGALSVGGTATLRVVEVRPDVKSTAIGRNQVVLSANSQSGAYYTDALRNVPLGAAITLTLTPADPRWNGIEYGVGALYSLVENGRVVPGLPSGASPRTAVGQRADGSLVFYTIDGRRPGHSIGATMTQTAKRLVELGCVTALCLDGGGSTTLTVTEPDSTRAKTVNAPSGGRERAVTNHLFLVADNTPTGKLHHFYVEAQHRYVLAGSKTAITASAVDTHYIPMDHDYTLTASSGTMDGNVLTTPPEGGDVTVTASSADKKGSAVVHAVRTPDSLTVTGNGKPVSSISLAPGGTITLRAAVKKNHRPLTADPAAFTWAVSGNVGTISPTGVFKAQRPGSGTITVSAGGKSVKLGVTVSSIPLHTVEDFEARFQPVGGHSASLEWTKAPNDVRYGRSAAKLTYDASGSPAQVQVNYPLDGQYDGLLLWVKGDGSGNQLALDVSGVNGQGTPYRESVGAGRLDFTGWKQLRIALPAGAQHISGVSVSGRGDGTLCLDQLVNTFGTVTDAVVPTVSVRADGGQLTAVVKDAVDGFLPWEALTVRFDGKDLAFDYSRKSGTITAALPRADGRAHRITVTGKDASGNIGRGSLDLPAAADWVPAFSDTKGYWAAPYVDFLYTAGITNGYADGTFRPGDNISRQEFAVMLYRYLDLDPRDYAGVELPFADLDRLGSFAVPAVKALYTEGIVNGTRGSDGELYFNPGDSLTRAQASAMIGRTQEKGYAAAPLRFSDAGAIPGYAAGYIQTMTAQGIIGGYADGTFKPNANITRGQMAKILYNLL